MNYIRTMRLNELKIEKEKEGKLFGALGKHTVFVDSIEEQESFNPEEFLIQMQPYWITERTDFA